MTSMVAEVYEAFKDAGVSDEKATAAAKAIAGNEMKEGLATKEDLQVLRADIHEMEARIIRTMLTTMISMTAIFAAIVKFF